MTNLTKASKKLSYLLRHAPADVFPLSRSGWAGVTEVCKELKITREQLQEIVDTDVKSRYKLVTPKFGDSVIKAVQGHSTDQVDLDFPTAVPQEYLFHGTPDRNVTSILENGLNAGSRQYVHLSTETDTAGQVGLRGTNRAAILTVDASEMAKDGFVFYVAENGVWLVHGPIPSKYLKVCDYRDK